MSSGWDDGAERFADAWDQQDAGRRPFAAGARSEGDGNARAPRPDDPTMRTPALDPELRRDLDLAAALREVSRTVPGPDAECSARMRASLMAAIGGAPADLDGPAHEDLDEQDGRLLAGAGSAGGRGAGRAGTTRTARAERGRQGTRPADERPGGRPGSVSARTDGPGRGTRRRSRSGRLLANAITGACAVMLLGALTVVLGRGALPGEMLYGVKRTSESVEMGLTSGQEAKGRKHLDFAALRLSEVGDLVERGGTNAAGAGPVASGLDPASAALVTENLREFDEQARAGARLILPLAGQPSGPSRTELADWARERSTQLDTLSPSLSGDDRVAATSSKSLMTRLSGRATDLDERRSCPEVSTGSDELGPLPSTARCAGVDEPRGPRVTAPSTTTSTTSSTSPSTRESTTTEEETSSSVERRTSRPGTTTSEPESPLSTPTERETPDPVQVPLPVPLLPPVDVPPILPGLPGISLGG